MISLDYLRLNKTTPGSVPPVGKVDLKVDPSSGLLAQLNADGSFSALGGGGTVDPSASFVAVTASRDLAESDNGKILVCNSADTITLTPLTTLSAGFNCGIVQRGAGVVSVSIAGGVNLNGGGGENWNSTEAYDFASLLHLPTAGDFLIKGDFGPSA